MNALRAGLVGLGMMGRNHARILSSLPGVDLVGIADPDPGVEQSWPCPRLADVAQLLDRGVDYVVVATPTASHAEIAVACADAGVHALVEKPLTTDVAQAKMLAGLFDRAGLIGAVGHVERYNPALQQAKSRLAHGDLGEVYQIATRRQGPFPGRIADVGVILDLATHDFDLTSWVADSDYQSVFARTAHRSGRAYEDLVAVNAQLRSGIVTSHLVNWLSPLKERVTVITGERGSFVADTLTADLIFHENGVVPTEWTELARFRGVSEGNVIRYAFLKPEPLRVEHERFRDAVLGHSSDVVSFSAAAHTVAVAGACAEAARTRQVQAVEDVAP